jgi:hypothetical protein
MTKDDANQLKSLLTRALAGDACAWNEFFAQIRKYAHAATLLGGNAALASVPLPLVSSTIKAATAVAAGDAGSRGC